MPTLHIEHPVTDMATWADAFRSFASVRREMGVVGERIQHPVDDPAFVVVDLDFDTPERAQGFLDFLHEQVWAIPANAPALAGKPQARILQVVRLDDLTPVSPGPTDSPVQDATA